MCMSDLSSYTEVGMRTQKRTNIPASNWIDFMLRWIPYYLLNVLQLFALRAIFDSWISNAFDCFIGSVFIIIILYFHEI